MITASYGQLPAKEHLNPMRPDKTASDLEYWLQQVQYWAQKAEEYFLSTAQHGLTPEDVQWFEARESRAREMQFRASLKHQECQGLITVYTGRAKPKWC